MEKKLITHERRLSIKTIIATGIILISLLPPVYLINQAISDNMPHIDTYPDMLRTGVNNYREELNSEKQVEYGIKYLSAQVPMD